MEVCTAPNFPAIVNGTQDMCNQMWIGARDIDNNGQFTWSDGRPFQYTNWQTGRNCLDLFIGLEFRSNTKRCCDFFVRSLKGYIVINFRPTRHWSVPVCFIANWTAGLLANDELVYRAWFTFFLMQSSWADAKGESPTK